MLMVTFAMRSPVLSVMEEDRGALFISAAFDCPPEGLAVVATGKAMERTYQASLGRRTFRRKLPACRLWIVNLPCSVGTLPLPLKNGMRAASCDRGLSSRRAEMSVSM